MPTIVKITAPLFGLCVTVVLVLAAVFFLRAVFTTPFQVFGMGEGPTQPIAFSHATHVETVGIECTFCHRTVEDQAAASIPALEQCLFCHKDLGEGDFIRAENPELAKLRNYFDTGTPVDWKRVHRLPDHVQFTHQPHITAGIPCSECHGDVGGMEVVEQVRDLKMGDCVDCHRAYNAPTDCVICHY